MNSMAFVGLPPTLLRLLLPLLFLLPLAFSQQPGIFNTEAAFHNEEEGQNVGKTIYISTLEDYSNSSDDGLDDPDFDESTVAKSTTTRWSSSLPATTPISQTWSTSTSTTSTPTTTTSTVGTAPTTLWVDESEDEPDEETNDTTSGTTSTTRPMTNETTTTTSTERRYSTWTTFRSSTTSTTTSSSNTKTSTTSTSTSSTSWATSTTTSTSTSTWSSTNTSTRTTSTTSSTSVTVTSTTSTTETLTSSTVTTSTSTVTTRTRTSTTVTTKTLTSTTLTSTTTTEWNENATRFCKVYGEDYSQNLVCSDVRLHSDSSSSSSVLQEEGSATVSAATPEALESCKAICPETSASYGSLACLGGFVFGRPGCLTAEQDLVEYSGTVLVFAWQIYLSAGFSPTEASREAFDEAFVSFLSDLTGEVELLDLTLHNHTTSADGALADVSQSSDDTDQSGALWQLNVELAVSSEAARQVAEERLTNLVDTTGTSTAAQEAQTLFLVALRTAGLPDAVTLESRGLLLPFTVASDQRALRVKTRSEAPCSSLVGVATSEIVCVDGGSLTVGSSGEDEADEEEDESDGSVSEGSGGDWWSCSLTCLEGSQALGNVACLEGRIFGSLACMSDSEFLTMEPFLSEVEVLAAVVRWAIYAPDLTTSTSTSSTTSTTSSTSTTSTTANATSNVGPGVSSDPNSDSDSDSDSNQNSDSNTNSDSDPNSGSSSAAASSLDLASALAAAIEAGVGAAEGSISVQVEVLAAVAGEKELPVLEARLEMDAPQENETRIALRERAESLLDTSSEVFNLTMSTLQALRSDYVVDARWAQEIAAPTWMERTKLTTSTTTTTTLEPCGLDLLQTDPLTNCSAAADDDDDDDDDLSSWKSLLLSGTSCVARCASTSIVAGNSLCKDGGIFGLSSCLTSLSSLDDNGVDEDGLGGSLQWRSAVGAIAQLGLGAAIDATVLEIALRHALASTVGFDVRFAHAVRAVSSETNITDEEGEGSWRIYEISLEIVQPASTTLVLLSQSLQQLAGNESSTEQAAYREAVVNALKVLYWGTELASVVVSTTFFGPLTLLRGPVQYRREVFLPHAGQDVLEPLTSTKRTAAGRVAASTCVAVVTSLLAGGPVLWMASWLCRAEQRRLQLAKKSW